GLYNQRLPLIAGFVAGFLLQLLVRLVVIHSPFLALLAPVTGVPALIYLFFMLPDPATTPERPKAQVAFGFAVALVYLVLVALHIVFGLFFALTIVCAVRGLWLYAWSMASRLATPAAAGVTTVPTPAPAPDAGA